MQLDKDALIPMKDVRREIVGENIICEGDPSSITMKYNLIVDYSVYLIL